MDKIVGDLVFPEGPLWWDGGLLFVETYAHRLSRWDGRRRATVWHEAGCGACAVERGPEGSLLVVCFESHALVRLTPEGKLLDKRATGDDGHPLTGANDLVSDGRGGHYITASGAWNAAAPPAGAVFHLRADGRLQRVAQGMHFTNGIAVLADRRTLVVAETLARRITAFAIQDDGSLGPARIFCRLDDLEALPLGADPLSGPDGMELHASGELWICDYGTGRVFVVDDKARLKRAIRVPGLGVTNLAFGPDGRDAYLTVVEEMAGPKYAGAIWRVDAS
jgi:sugar lactone lactonase YvrE